MPDDFSELDSLARDLGEVAGNAGGFINSAVQVTSVRIKKDAAKSVSSSKYWIRAAGAIGYEITVEAGVGGSSIKSEIGYDKDKVLGHKAPKPNSRRRVGPGTAGDLGSLREFGAPGRSLAPHNDLANALHANEADFEHGLSVALRDAEREAGL